MSILAFPCEACVDCDPCPPPLKIEASKYDKKGCVSGVEVTTDTTISLGITYPYPDTGPGIIGVTYVLAYVGDPTTPVTSGTPTVGQRLYRKADGSCNYTSGTMYFTYDPAVYVVAYLEVEIRSVFMGVATTLTKLVYLEEGPAYDCKPCTNQRGESVYKVGANTNSNSANLTPSAAGAVGSDCSPGGSGTPRITEVAQWLGTECCPEVEESGDLIAAGCSPYPPAELIDIYKNDGLCGSITDRGEVTCSDVVNYNAPLLDFPNVHSGSGTLSLSTADGDISLSLAINKASCADPVLSGVCVLAANPPPGAGCGSGTTSDTDSCFIDVGHPCYKYKLTATLSGLFFEDNVGSGCGYCNGTDIGCNGSGYYNNVYRRVDITGLTLELVPI